MRDAFGAVYYMKFFIVFICIFIAILAIALNYAKAFRVKNMIINYIESNDGWSRTLEDEDIEDYVKEVNYYVNNVNLVSNYAFSVTNGGFDSGCRARGYCIYRQIDNDGRGVYYKVVTYTQIIFPLFNLHIEVPISGETKLVTELHLKK